VGGRQVISDSASPAICPQERDERHPFFAPRFFAASCRVVLPHGIVESSGVVVGRIVFDIDERLTQIKVRHHSSRQEKAVGFAAGTSITVSQQLTQ
jgi:hypothetical protein